MREENSGCRCSQCKKPCGLYGAEETKVPESICPYPPGSPHHCARCGIFVCPHCRDHCCRFTCFKDHVRRCPELPRDIPISWATTSVQIAGHKRILSALPSGILGLPHPVEAQLLPWAIPTGVQELLHCEPVPGCAGASHVRVVPPDKPFLQADREAQRLAGFLAGLEPGTYALEEAQRLAGLLQEGPEAFFPGGRTFAHPDLTAGLPSTPIPGDIYWVPDSTVVAGPRQAAGGRWHRRLPGFASRSSPSSAVTSSNPVVPKARAKAKAKSIGLRRGFLL